MKAESTLLDKVTVAEMVRQMLAKPTSMQRVYEMLDTAIEGLEIMGFGDIEFKQRGDVRLVEATCRFLDEPVRCEFQLVQVLQLLAAYRESMKKETGRFVHYVRQPILEVYEAMRDREDAFYDEVFRRLEGKISKYMKGTAAGGFGSQVLVELLRNKGVWIHS